MPTSTSGNDHRSEDNGVAPPQLDIRVVAMDQSVVVAVGGENDFPDEPAEATRRPASSSQPSSTRRPV